jgi:hypothetical protein
MSEPEAKLRAIVVHDEAFIRLGAAGILNKPFDRARIRAKLEGIFPGRLAAPAS